MPLGEPRGNEAGNGRMANKKTSWVGLLAILTAGPALALSAPMASTQEPVPALLGLPHGSASSAPMSAEPAPLPKISDAVPIRPVFTPTPIPPAPAAPGTRWSIRSTYAPVLGDVPGLVLVGEAKAGEQKKEPAPAQPTPKAPEPKAPETPPTPPTTSAAPETQSGSSLASFFGLPSVAGTTSSATTATAAPAASTNITGQSAVPAQGVGNLLANSNSAQGVEVQKRSPLVGDPRVEGLHFGQIVTQADGGYWFPARVDLDTVVSKLDPSDISNILVIRGPYSVRYGPGFSFIDIQSLPTPRSTDGLFDIHGSTSFTYRTNGQGLQGQQSVWGGNTDWGFRVTYEGSASGDYVTGNGTKMPSSYNNQFVDFAFGYDLSRNETVEVRYMHVQQSNVLLPGLLTDINSLTTDAFSGRYTATQGHWFDRFTLDVWINNTTFNGDSSNTQTRTQIPALNNIFPANLSADNAVIDTIFNPVRLDITTNGNALSYGTREITTWGDVKGMNISVGADARVFSNSYTEYDAFNLSVLPGTGQPANLGIPDSRQIDVGGFVDGSLPLGERFILKAGGRMDYVSTQFLQFVPNVSTASYLTSVGEPVDRNFILFSSYATAEYKIAPAWTAQLGYGFAERPPTLTELYTGGAFLGLIQNGFNSIYGNPGLLPEQLHQMNASLTAKYDTFRAGGNAFYAFVPDYITYDFLGPFTVANIAVPESAPLTGTTPINRLRFINTGLATLYGFDAYGEWDALPWLTPFATLSFVEGWDQTRDEALPGIPPLASRAGLRFHEPGANQRWGMEYFARMVATQNLYAASLGEQRTGGFVVHYIRAYWQPRPNMQLLAGIENIGNLQYREHLDLRTGLGVFQPGINFYGGVKVSY